jgi:hypothetical protein
MWLCRRRFCSALEAIFMETTTERPVFFSMACVVTWIRCRFSFASQEDNEYSSLMKRGLVMQFSRGSFFRSRISQWISPHGVHPTDHDMRQRQLPELFFDPR